jgi:hypothetical protein
MTINENDLKNAAKNICQQQINLAGYSNKKIWENMKHGI